jgi:ABC-2 type transport system permease protein
MRPLFYAQVFLAYLGNFVKSRLTYRGDFLAFFLGDFFLELVGLLFIWTIYQHVPDIRGWTYGEMLFIFGFSQITIGLFYCLFLNLFSLSEEYIVEGRFDRVLTRPLNTLFQVVIERIYLEESSQVIVGMLVTAYAIRQGELNLGGSELVLLPFLVFCGTVIYAGFFVGLMSLAFWFKERTGIWRPFESMNIFGRYPVTIYNRYIMIAISWVIPYAFTAFYPASHFLGHTEFRLYVWLTPFVALWSATLGYLVWTAGVRMYESAGS